MLGKKQRNVKNSRPKVSCTSEQQDEYGTFSAALEDVLTV